MRGRNHLRRIASLCVHLLRRFWLTLHRSCEMLLRRHRVVPHADAQDIPEPVDLHLEGAQPRKLYRTIAPELSRVIRCLSGKTRRIIVYVAKAGNILLSRREGFIIPLTY